ARPVGSGDWCGYRISDVDCQLSGIGSLESEPPMKTKLVFTTDPEEAKRLRESSSMPLVRDAAPAAQNIRGMLDGKRRGGMTVTVASGFELSAESLEKLAGQLKKR